MNEKEIKELDQLYYKALESPFGLLLAAHYPLPPSEIMHSAEINSIMARLVARKVEDQ